MGSPLPRWVASDVSDEQYSIEGLLPAEPLEDPLQAASVVMDVADQSQLRHGP